MTSPTPPTPSQTVTFDLYRDAHKAIRSELFAVTEHAGRLDPAQPGDRAALANHMHAVVDLLVSHAEHEENIEPALTEHLGDLADQIRSDHEILDTRLHELGAQADAAVDAPAATARRDIHHLYQELAAFSASYLEHQDLEERVVMPALEKAIGVDAVIAIHEKIVASVPPDRKLQFLAVMLPAMNVDDRTELLGGFRAGLSAGEFEAVWSLAGSVLTGPDHAELANRLGCGTRTTGDD